MRRRITIACLLVLVGGTAFLLMRPRPTVDNVMADFYDNNSQRAEDKLIAPLILHSDLVTGRVIEEIKNRSMEKRRYAIGFLGIIRASEALPVLQEILNDDTEIDYFRADALESIYRISNGEGLRLAANYQERDDLLGYISTDLIRGSHKPFERSYAQALFGHHE